MGLLVKDSWIPFVSRCWKIHKIPPPPCSAAVFMLQDFFELMHVHPWVIQMGGGRVNDSSICFSTFFSTRWDVSGQKEGALGSIKDRF